MKIYTVNATCELAGVVADLAGGNPLDNRIIFCEDKFTLESEIALSKKYGGTFGTRVFSFNRFMHKYLPDSGEILSPESASLVIKRLLLENKGELTCFKNVYDPNLSSAVYELIAQLKSAKISPADVFRAAEGSSGILKRKLDDIYILFDAYEHFIAEKGLTDGNNRLSRLPEFFNTDAAIKNTDVIVAGFPSLNRTLCNIFKSLAKNAKSLTFALVAGENKGVYTNETFDFAMREFGAEHIAVGGSRTRERLLSSLFMPSAKNRGGEFCPDVHIYRAQSVNEEVGYAAKLIASGVRQVGGIAPNYKNYAVCAENIDDYYLTIKRVFSDYGIPCFFDRTTDLKKHPLTNLVCAYIDTVRRGFAVSDYLRFVKNPLICPDKGISDGFENYVLKHVIDRKGIFKKFTCRDDMLEEFEKVRAFTTGLFETEYFRKKEKTIAFSSAVDMINDLLEKIDAESGIERLSEELTDFNREELAAVNAQAYEKFTDVLSAAARILGDKIMPLSEVKNVIVSGMAACKISVIQEFSDCVFVGDFRSVKYKEYPVLFALGMNDGVPSTKFDSALLCDRDIAGMEEFDVSVEPKIKEVNKRNRENTCMALAAFGRKLYLSWAGRNADGQESKKSEIVDYVTAIFSESGENGRRIVVSDKFSNDVSAEKVGGERGKRYKALPYMTERSSAFGFAREISAFKEGEKNEFEAAASFYAVMKEKGLRALPDGLLGAVNTEIGYYTDGVNYAAKDISATAIEGFFRCPYKNFLQRGVRLNSREEGDMRANVIGNLIHEAAEEFTARVNFDDTDLSARTLAENIFEEISQREEYSRYRATGAGKAVFAFLKKETVRFCLNVFNGCNNSSFRPAFGEIAFGFGGNLPAIAIDTRNGRRKIIGKADRIDTFENKMRIIDYKTGTVDGNDDENLYSGKKLQLYLYAKAFSDKFSPVGAYYFPIADNYGEDEEAVMAMKGKTLADLKTASEIDNTITDENRKGRFVSANLTEKKGGGFRYDSMLLTREEFDAYLDYAIKIAAEGVSEINEGVIIPSPDEKACEFCEYHGLCGYDGALDGRTREINEKITKESVVKALKEENDGLNAEDGAEEKTATGENTAAGGRKNSAGEMAAGENTAGVTASGDNAANTTGENVNDKTNADNGGKGAIL